MKSSQRTKAIGRRNAVGCSIGDTVVVAAALLFLCTNLAYAAGPRSTPYSLDIEYSETHAPDSPPMTGEARYYWQGDVTPTPLRKEAPEVFEAPVGANISIRIKNPNRILYAYTAGKPSETPTDNATALQKFANSLGSFASGKELARSKEAAALSQSGDENEPSYTGLLFDNIQVALFMASLAEYRDELEKIKAFLRRYEVDRRAAPAETELEAWRTTVEEITRELARFQNLMGYFSDVKFSYVPASYAISGKASVFTLLSELERNPNYRKLRDTPKEAEIREEANFLVYLALNYREVADLVKLTSELIKEMASLDDESALMATIEVKPNVNIAQPISIAANHKYDTFLDEELIKKRDKFAASIGERTIVFAPDDLFRISIAPGLIYSFVRNPEYSVSQKGKNLLINQSSNDYAAVEGAVALNVTLKSWEGHSFVPHLQFGLAPDSDKVAFLLGVGFHSTTGLSFSIGPIYQRINKLQSGLAVGQVISSPDDLKTESEFKSGLYISLDYLFKL